MYRTKEIVVNPLIEMDDKESQGLWGVITKWFKANSGRDKSSKAININCYINGLMTKAYVLGQKEGPSEIK